MQLPQVPGYVKDIDHALNSAPRFLFFLVASSILPLFLAVPPSGWRGEAGSLAAGQAPPALHMATSPTRG